MFECIYLLNLDQNALHCEKNRIKGIYPDTITFKAHITDFKFKKIKIKITENINKILYK